MLDNSILVDFLEILFLSLMIFSSYTCKHYWGSNSYQPIPLNSGLIRESVTCDWFSIMWADRLKLRKKGREEGIGG